MNFIVENNVHRRLKKTHFSKILMFFSKHSAVFETEESDSGRSLGHQAANESDTDSCESVKSAQ